MSSFQAKLLERLRSATRERHAELDACLPEGLANRRTYVAYLRAMSGLAGAVAATPRSSLPPSWRPWHDAERAAAVARDLDCFGRGPCAWPDEVLSSGAWIGAAYVFEGSALGACLLRRQATELAAIDHSVVPALAFLTLHASSARRWPDFVQRLGDVPSASHAAVVEGAIHAFSLTRLLLDEALSQ